MRSAASVYTDIDQQIHFKNMLSQDLHLIVDIPVEIIGNSLPEFEGITTNSPKIALQENPMGITAMEGSAIMSEEDIRAAQLLAGLRNSTTRSHNCPDKDDNSYQSAVALNYGRPNSDVKSRWHSADQEEEISWKQSRRSRKRRRNNLIEGETGNPTVEDFHDRGRPRFRLMYDILAACPQQKSDTFQCK